MPDTRRFRPSPNAATQGVGNELVFLDLEGGEFFVSKGVGIKVWELLAAGQSIAEVAAEITTRYGIPDQQAERDVQAFVESLLDKALLELASGSSGGAG